MKRALLLALLLAAPALSQPVTPRPCRMDGLDCGPLPSQATHSGKYLTTNGTTASWAAAMGLSGGTASRLGIWTAADAMSSHPGLLADATTGVLTIGAQSDVVPVTLRAYSSGTSSIMQWQTSGNAPRGAIGHDGELYAYSTASTGASDYERVKIGLTAGSGVTIAAETAGTGADNLNITLAPAGTGAVYVGASSQNAQILRLTGATGIDFGYDIGTLDRWASTSKTTYIGSAPALVTNATETRVVGALMLTSTSTVLVEDSVGVVAQRNTTNAQTFRVYGTYTDASNYVRASLAATSAAVTLAAETAGTGADDVPIEITPAGAGLSKITRLRVVDSGTKPTCDSTTRGVIWMDEGGAGVADTLEVCKKDAGDAYAWSALF